MNRTIKLLRVIGSPFALEKERELPENQAEALELYDYAIKNKIGLLYLETLKDSGKLEEFELNSKYKEELRKHEAQLITAARVSELFNSSNIKYAIFKSIMPFPATPNDVDIIHFGSTDDFEKAAEIMLQSNYLEVKGRADAEQRMFHDAKHGGYLDPHPLGKDVYDVDIYQKIAASYILYLDKGNLEKHIIEMDLASNKIKILKPDAELLTIIIHSMFPEMLFTHFVYYATLYYLADMNSEDINSFLTVVKENNGTFCVKAHFSVLAELHKAAHGFVPDKVDDILVKLGDERRERKTLVENALKMPHRYGLLTVAMILLEKAKESRFRRSFIKQIGYMLVSPRLTKWVIYNIRLRLTRETY